MPLVFVETGSDATGGLEFYDQAAGAHAPVSTTTQAMTGLRSIRCQGNGTSYVVKNAVLADSGRRLQCHLRLSALPVNSPVVLMLVANNLSEVYSVRITSAGVIQLFANGVQIGSDGATLSTGTWYRLTLSYKVTSLSVNSANVWVDGASNIAVTNATLGATGGNNFSLGWITDPGLTSSDYLYLDNIYVHDGTLVDDPGDRRMTIKRPAFNNFGEFDTFIGSNPGARYTNVNECPISTAEGWAHAAQSDARENYTLQSGSQGDVNISGKVITGHCGWVYAKRGLADGRFVQMCAKAADANVVTSLQVNNTGADTAAGNTLVLCLAIDNPTPLSSGLITVTDSAGNNYQIAIQDNGITADSSDTVRTLIAYALNAQPVLANGHWTLSIPAVKNKAVIVTEFAGIVSRAVLRAHSQSDATFSPTSGATSGSTESEQIVVGAIGFNGVAADWSAVGSGMTHVDLVATSNLDTNIGLEVQYALQTTLAAQTAAGTLGQLDKVTCCVACFQCSGILVGSPTLFDNNNEFALTLTTTPALYYQVVTSSSYPASSQGIGMRSGGRTPDTYLYACGCVIVYQP